jgi:hypothetical protein
VGWTFFYMFVVLKIPVAAALWLVWWSVREEPAAADDSQRSDGGSGGNHPRPRHPRPPRRGPHSQLPPRPPSRVRVKARVATAAHR